MSVWDDLSADEFGISSVIREEFAANLERNVGQLTRASAEYFASFADRSDRTMYRWRRKLLGLDRTSQPSLPDEQLSALDTMALTGPKGFWFDDEMIALLYLCGGNQKALRDALEAGGYDVPSEATISRRARDIDRHVRDGARWGQKHRYRNLLQIRHEVDFPYEVAELDEFTLDIEVLRPGARVESSICRPRVCLVLDAKSRYILEAATTPAPIRTADVLCLLAAAAQFKVDPATGVIIGGLPQIFRVDNGGPFRSRALVEVCELVGVGLTPATAYSPTQKAKVERAGQTIQDDLVRAMAGRRTRNETISGNDALATPDNCAMTWEAWEARFTATIDAYNRRRQPMLGAAPIELISDAGRLGDTIPDEVAAMLWLPHGRDNGIRKVHPDGIHIGGRRTYQHPALDDLLDSTVEVRAPHHRTDRVAVVTPDGTFVAMVDQKIGDKDRERLVADRLDQLREVGRNQAIARTASVINTATVEETGIEDILGALAAAIGRTTSATDNDSDNAEEVDDVTVEPVAADPVAMKKRRATSLDTMDPEPPPNPDDTETDATGPEAAVHGAMPDEAENRRPGRRPDTTARGKRTAPVTPKKAKPAKGIDLARGALGDQAPAGDESDGRDQ